MRFFLGIICLLPVLHAQSIGAKYGTRDPIACKSTKDPARGAPSPDLAAQYVRCGFEHVDRDNEIWILENLKTDIGKSRPFTRDLLNMTDADTTQPIYPIRGSYTKYICREKQYAPGKNCHTYESTGATGVCYRTTFGDWKCSLLDLNEKSIPNQPPPSGK